LHKFYRICPACIKTCRSNKKERRLWFYGRRDVDEDDTTKHPPGSDEKIAMMRKRLMQGLELFNEGDNHRIDWDRVNLVGMYSEAIQREAGFTGVERDGTHWRARPMAGGRKHNLGEFDTEAEALGMVEWFWIGWLGLPLDATKEEIAEARANDACGTRVAARKRLEERRHREKRAMAMAEVTPLFG
jgi:hypothetical protein